MNEDKAARYHRLSRRTSLLDLVRNINEMRGTQVHPIHDEARPGDVRHSQADISRAQAELGFQPRYELAQGLRLTLDYFLQGPKS